MLFVCICCLLLFVCTYYVCALCVRVQACVRVRVRAERGTVRVVLVTCARGDLVFVVGSCSLCVRARVVLIIVMCSRCVRALVLVVVVSWFSGVVLVVVMCSRCAVPFLPVPHRLVLFRAACRFFPCRDNFSCVMS